MPVTARVRILVQVHRLTAFRQLLRSLDRTPSLDGGVLVVADPAGLDAASRETFDRLVRHRADVRVGDDPEGAEWDLPLEETDVLAPGAVDLLLAHAVATGADVVLGRRAAAPPSWELFAHDHAVPAAEVTVDVADLPVLVRGGTAPSGSVADRRRAAVREATTVAVLAQQVVLLGSSVALEEVPATRVEGTWRDGALELGLGEPVERVVLTNLDTGTAWTLPAEPGGSVRIDPRRAAFGRPLERGRWVVDAVGSAAHALTVDRLPRCALLDDGLVVPVRSAGRLVLDVGATQRFRGSAFPPHLAEIVETHEGSRLRWGTTLVDLTSGADVPAVLKVGPFPTRAVLRPSGDGVVVEAWMSGLPSRSALALSVAGSELHALGSDLVIENVGAMSVRTRPAPAKPAPAPTAPPSGLRARMARVPGARRVRRALRRR